MRQEPSRAVLSPFCGQPKVRQFNKRFYEEFRREAKKQDKSKAGKGGPEGPAGASAHQVNGRGGVCFLLCLWMLLYSTTPFCGKRLLIDPAAVTRTLHLVLLGTVVLCSD